MNDKIWVNVQMDQEMVQQLMEIADRYGRTLGARLNRSDVVRLACSTFLQNQKIVDVQELPGPDGHLAVPVVLVEGDPVIRNG